MASFHMWSSKFLPWSIRSDLHDLATSLTLTLAPRALPRAHMLCLTGLPAHRHTQQPRVKSWCPLCILFLQASVARASWLSLSPAQKTSPQSGLLWMGTVSMAPAHCNMNLLTLWLMVWILHQNIHASREACCFFSEAVLLLCVFLMLFSPVPTTMARIYQVLHKYLLSKYMIERWMDECCDDWVGSETHKRKFFWCNINNNALNHDSKCESDAEGKN